MGKTDNDSNLVKSTIKVEPPEFHTNVIEGPRRSDDILRLKANMLV